MRIVIDLDDVTLRTAERLAKVDRRSRKQYIELIVERALDLEKQIDTA